MCTSGSRYTILSYKLIAPVAKEGKKIGNIDLLTLIILKFWERRDQIEEHHAGRQRNFTNYWGRRERNELKRKTRIFWQRNSSAASVLHQLRVQQATDTAVSRAVYTSHWFLSMAEDEEKNDLFWSHYSCSGIFVSF